MGEERWTLIGQGVGNIPLWYGPWIEDGEGIFVVPLARAQTAEEARDRAIEQRERANAISVREQLRAERAEAERDQLIEAEKQRDQLIEAVRGEIERLRTETAKKGTGLGAYSAGEGRASELVADRLYATLDSIQGKEGGSK